VDDSVRDQLTHHKDSCLDGLVGPPSKILPNEVSRHTSAGRHRRESLSLTSGSRCDPVRRPSPVAGRVGFSTSTLPP
jgi:hypothetical protein